MPPLIIGEDIISDDDRKAEALNDYFCSQTNISIQNNHIEFLRQYKTEYIKTSHTFRFTEITPDEVLHTISKMDASKACGPDKLPTKLIKMTAA